VILKTPPNKEIIILSVSIGDQSAAASRLPIYGSRFPCGGPAARAEAGCPHRTCDQHTMPTSASVRRHGAATPFLGLERGFAVWDLDEVLRGESSIDRSPRSLPITRA